MTGSSPYAQVTAQPSLPSRSTPSERRRSHVSVPVGTRKNSTRCAPVTSALRVSVPGPAGSMHQPPSQASGGVVVTAPITGAAFGFASVGFGRSPVGSASDAVGPVGFASGTAAGRAAAAPAAPAPAAPAPAVGSASTASTASTAGGAAA